MLQRAIDLFRIATEIPHTQKHSDPSSCNASYVLADYEAIAGGNKRAALVGQQTTETVQKRVKAYTAPFVVENRTVGLHRRSIEWEVRSSLSTLRSWRFGYLTKRVR